MGVTGRDFVGPEFQGGVWTLLSGVGPGAGGWCLGCFSHPALSLLPDRRPPQTQSSPPPVNHL